MEERRGSVFNIFNNNDDESAQLTNDANASIKLISTKRTIAEKLVEDPNTKKVLNTLDIFISVTIVTAMIVGCWRGLWQLIDQNGEYFPLWPSFIFSNSIHLSLVLAREGLFEVVTEIKYKDKQKKYELLSKIFGRVYIYFFHVIGIIQWRSTWILYDQISGLEFNDNFLPKETTLKSNVLLAVSFVAILLLKCVKNLVAAPFGISLDRRVDAFNFPTRFKTEVTEKTSLYILDCLFSVLVIGTLVVFVWRGGWTLCDVYIFPNDLTVSSWTSLVIGYALVIIIFLLQPIMKWICDRITGGYRLFVTDVYLTLSLVATINVWRGIWNLLNIYLLPDDLETSCWITHWVCLIILILMNCSNSLLVRGVYIDAEEPAGKCVVFPCHYLRIIFYNERLKKLKALELENVQKKKGEVQSTVTTVPLEKNHVIKMNSNEHRVEMNHT